MRVGSFHQLTPETIKTLAKRVQGNKGLLEAFLKVLDPNYVEPGKTFIDVDESMTGLMNVVVIHAIYTVLSAPADVISTILSSHLMCETIPAYMLECRDGALLLLLKIMFVDIFTFFSCLNRVMTLYAESRPTFPDLDPKLSYLEFWNPFWIYESLLQISPTAERFYEGYLQDCPAALEFVLSVLRNSNQTVVSYNKLTRSLPMLEFHSDLKAFLIEEHAESRLAYDPTPLIKQIDIYLQQ